MENKVALVTGASRGIGKAIALRLAADGYDVAVNYNSGAEAANDTVAQITALGRKAIALKANVSDVKEVSAMFRAAVSELGRLDVLVNNAGIVEDAFLLMLKEDSLSRCIDINLKGYFFCAQAATLKMFKNKKGCIINVSSVSSMMALPGQSVYAATKGAINSMTATLARELAPYGVRVNAIAPGFIQTEMVDNIPEEKREEYKKNIPLGRIGEVSEVAGAVSFLCSDAAAYITGQVLVIDGGLAL